MSRRGSRFAPKSKIKTAALIAAAVLTATAAAAQTPEWRITENPYQEDIEYELGSTHTPMVEVDQIRWRSFNIARPDFGLVEAEETISVDVTFEFENRRDKSAKVLVILLLENENGDPLERIEARPLKLAAGRFKERKETAKLSVEILRAARRAYLFFEVLD
jgi:hypothetical protein